MGRFVFYLVLLGGIAYGGLYFYYGIAIKQGIEAEFAERGFDAVEVTGVEYGPLALVSREAEIATSIAYRGAEATLDIRLDGHPLFSDEVNIQLDGLQALRLTRGGDN